MNRIKTPVLNILFICGCISWFSAFGQQSTVAGSDKVIEQTWKSLKENYKVPQWFTDGKFGIKKETGENSLSGQEFRFTVNGENLYAFDLSLPGKEAVIMSLGKNSPFGGEIVDVQLLDYNGDLPYDQDSEGLRIGIPEEAVSSPALTFRIKGAQMEPPVLKFDFGSGDVEPGYKKVTGDMVYNRDRGYGFISELPVKDIDRKGKDALRRDFCTSDKPFYFVVDLPEGNYEVTITFGDRKGESVNTVKAESRRLMLYKVMTARGEFKTESFIVNVRTPRIDPQESIRLKQREIGYLNWDDKLTLEFGDSRPCIDAVGIKEVKDVITVFLAGNSTVTDQEKEPWAAWGQMIPCFFTKDVVVANYAESGEALKSFVAENRLKKIMQNIRPGDYLFIQFGHNDQKQNSSAYVEAFTGYKDELKLFIREARERGARPVLVTSMHRRNFDENGKIINTHGNYPEAMRQVASEEHVPLIDLNAMSALLYEALGVEGSKRAFVHYPANSFPGQEKELADNSHHSTYGAYQLAKCIVEGIKSNVPDLAAYLKDTPSYHPENPDPFEEWNWPVSPAFDSIKPEGY
jgi:lysophospholipase L1-like esterase